MEPETTIKNRQVHVLGNLSLTKSFYEALLNNCAEAIVLIDDSGRVKYQNHSVFSITGFDIEEVHQKPAVDFIHPEDVEDFKEFFTGLLAEPGVQKQKQYRLLHKKGHYFWIEGSMTNLLNDPNVNGFVASYRDITKRNEAEQMAGSLNTDLKRSLAETSDYKYALDASSIVTIVGADGNIRYVNDNFCKISKFTAQEVIGHNPRIFNSGYHTKEFFTNLWSTVRQGKIWKGNIRNKTKDGNYYWGDTTIVPFLDTEGKPFQYLVIRNDISDKVSVQQKLDEAHFELNKLFNTISEVLFSVNIVQYQVIQMSPACEKVYGYSADDFYKDRELWRNVIHPDDQHLVQGHMSDLDNGKEVHNEYRIIHKNGSVRWVENSITPTMDEHNKLMRIDGITKDISARKFAEENAFYNELRVKETQAIAHLGNWETNLATGVSIWSEEQCRIYGLDPANRVQSFEIWKAFIHPDDKDFAMKLINDSKESFAGKSFSYRIVRRDGSIRHVHTESKYDFDSSGKPKGLYGITQDMTEMKLAELKIAESEKRFRALIENSSDMLTISDICGQFQYASPNILKFLGYKPENFINTKGVQIIHPDEIDDYSRIFTEVRQNPGKSYHFVKRMKHAEGHWIWTEGSATNLLHIPAIHGIITNFRDITERKQAESEIKELNEHLEDRVNERTADLTEANNALQAFSSTVSHDLRAPVRAVTSFAKIIQHDYGTNMAPEMKELFGYIEESGNRMNAIIEDLLRLAKYGNQTLRIEPVDMTRLINGVWHNISRTTVHEAVLEAGQLPAVQVDMSMMQQVVVNLLSNAIKYSSKTHKPRVSVWSEQTADKIIFYFKDNGAGFDMKNYDRLFAAFQRLHGSRDFEGTGVGLSLVKRIIEKHGGTVGAEAKVDEGATFWFTLPFKNAH